MIKTLNILPILNKTRTLKMLSNHPFPLFVYLEWILLSIFILMEFRLIQVTKSPFITSKSPLNPVLLILIFIIFGIMGLRLPRERILEKIIYIFGGLFLLSLANLGLGRGMGFPPPLLLILVLRSCLVFKIRGRLLVSALSWIFFIFTLNTNIPLQVQNQLKVINSEELKQAVLDLQFTAGLLFSCILLFVLLLVNAVVSERQSRQKLVLANDKLRQYALRIEDQATLQERSRIAREIHDSIGHSLTAQSIQLENALLFIDSNIDKAKCFLVQAKNMGANALKEVRFSVSALRSDPLKGRSLEFAIEDLFQEFESRLQIKPKFDLEIDQTLSPDINMAVYRIAQEALTNICKHSNADKVTIEIKTIDNSLYLHIEDNGVGFHPNQNTTGFGLQSMRDRAHALGGKFYINSEPEEGCSIMMFLPLSELN